MNNIWDQIATVHRNTRAFALGAGFLLILAWGAYQLHSTKLVNTTRTTAVVEKITPYQLGYSGTYGKGSGNTTFYRGRLIFADSTWVEMQMIKPLPEVGDRLPVIIEHYDNGSKHYSVDWVDWQTHGAD